MYEISTTEYEDPATGTRYRVRIVSDEDATSPRDADNPTVMHTFDQDHCSPDNDHPPGARFFNPTPIVPSEYVSEGDGLPVNMRYARKYAALDPDILAIAGLYRQPDGGLALDLDGTDEADGYIAITRESWQRTWLGEADRKPADALREVMQQEMDAYNRWQCGEYVGVVVEEQVTWHAVAEGRPDSRKTYLAWEEVDSLWGIDDQDYARQEALSWLPEGLQPKGFTLPEDIEEV